MPPGSTDNPSGKRLVARDRALDTSRPLVMGIVNRTPDSFYDKGSYFAFDAFLRVAEERVAAGADIIDIGGVKAGPGEEVTLDEELERVVPAVAAVAERFDVAISADTWRAAVLKEALAAGAHIGNDISGLRDPEYAPVAARYRAAVVCTHIRLEPRVPDPDPHYGDLVGEVAAFLGERAVYAESLGVARESVVVDAGFDLGKTTPQSLELLRRTAVLASQGYPVLISASNKGFLGEALDLPISERRSASLAAACFGLLSGASIFRVHDVGGTRRALDAIAAIAERRSR